MLLWPTKDPDDELDYLMERAPDLEVGEAIVTSTWIVPSDLVKVTDLVSGTDTIIWLSGGVHNMTYTITNRIVTDSTPPRTMDLSVRLPVREN